MLGWFKKKPKAAAKVAAQAAAAEPAPVTPEPVAPQPDDVPLCGAKVTILGMGASGCSAARLGFREGARVRVVDRRTNLAMDGLPDGIECCMGEDDDTTTAALLDSQLIVLSPGVPRSLPALAAAEAAGVPVIAEVELASRHLSAPLIAITGTNGKSTVTSWVGHILRGWKDHVFTGANLGEPLSEAALADTPWDFVVAELSSFQLEAITTLAPTVAVLLNTSADHLDRYPKVGDYYRAKFNLFAHMNGGYALFNEADGSTDLVVDHYLHGAAPVLFNRTQEGDGLAIRDGIMTLTSGGREQPIVVMDTLQLSGTANAENAQASAAICLLAGCPLNRVAEGLASFSGLPHRMETVPSDDGITWINDSKATNPGAVAKALDGLPGPTTLLLGGRDKGGDLFTLREQAFQHADQVILFGESGGRFLMVLQGHPALTQVDSLADAVQAARRVTPSGGTVLLSPACASFDEFGSFGERGDAFKRLVSTP